MSGANFEGITKELQEQPRAESRKDSWRISKISAERFLERILKEIFERFWAKPLKNLGRINDGIEKEIFGVVLESDVVPEISKRIPGIFLRIPKKVSGRLIDRIQGGLQDGILGVIPERIPEGSHEGSPGNFPGIFLGILAEIPDVIPKHVLEFLKETHRM